MTFSTSAVAVCCCKRFFEVAGARLHLVEQAHVLDRDDGLVGEGLDELDLALREGPGARARISVNTPSTLAVSQQGHSQR